MQQLTEQISLAVTVFSVALAIFFYVRSRRVKKPVYAMRSTNLIHSPQGHASLEVKFGGLLITNLTATKVLFLNKGHETISRNDIATTSPLTIVAKGETEILDAEVLQVV